MDQRVSIILPAGNAASSIEDCLRSLVAQQTDGVEILVVDDASADDTASLAESMGVRVLRREQNGGPAAARNLGVQHAKGDVLFFVDADVVLHDGAVARVRDCFERNPSLAAVFGSYDTEPRARGVVSQYRNLLHHFVHQQGKREASTFWAGCGAIRRSAFLQVGGFDAEAFPRPSIEDIELGYRLRDHGYAIAIDPGLQGTHLKRWTLGSMVRTDLLCRAIPWTRLNLERGAAPDDLNIRKSQKISVALAALASLSIPLAFLTTWAIPFGMLAVMVIVLLNLYLFRFLGRERGIFFAMLCVPLHLLYFFYSGLGFLWVNVAHHVAPRTRESERPGPMVARP